MPFYAREYLASLPDAQRQAFTSSHTVFGYHPNTGEDFYVPDADRYSGTYMLGAPGNGKSGEMENLILADVWARRPVIVIDPHGDLIKHCLALVPTDRTFLLDMEDEAYPFGINMLSTGTLTTDLERSAAVARIEHIFEVLWEEVLSQANLPRYLRMAILVFLANPGKTLVDMYDFFLDDSFRRSMLQAVTDPTVKQFWQFQYDNLPPQTRIGKVQPLLGRLEQLFAGRALVRNILGQSRNTIDFRAAIERKQIIFIRLPLRTAEQDARLIGTILLAQIHAALFSFVDLPPDKRPGVSLYMDEFQNFATEDIKELLSEGRKFGMRLTIAHQYREQLTAKLQEATMTAATKVCFHLTPKNGSELAHEFPAPAGTVKPEHVDAHASETLTNHPHLHPVVIQEFIETYLRPIILQQVGAHGNKVKITRPGYGLLDFADHMLYSDPRGYRRAELPEVENPLVYLDYLLQQVMVSGLYREPIPVVAVRGFANCGHSFWQKVRSMADDHWLLRADIPELSVPLHLIAPDGSWTRTPESENEQLLHFLYHLRVTMRYLAEQPLGTKTQMTNAEVGKMLNSLPKRAAFIRNGQDTGVIYTHDVPGPISQHELIQAALVIRDATRKTYCRPRAEVEQALLGAPMPPVAPSPVPAAPMPPSAPAGAAAQPVLSGWE